MPSRDPAVTAAYQKYLQQADDTCPFCELGDRRLIFENMFFVIVEALFPYKIWDEKQVREHLMILPRRHVESFANFTAFESSDFTDIIAEYESHGYSIYARAPQDTMRSISHQHTHLLLLER